MADQTLARVVNERSILTLLRQQGGHSRAAIARALALTPATITRLTSDMLARGLLREVAAPEMPPAEREPGRPGISVAVDPEGAYFLGVEIGVSVLRFVLIDLMAAVVEASELRVPRRVTPEEAVAEVRKVWQGFQADPRYAGKVRGAGLTVPGLVTTTGFVVNLPILGWRETDLQPLLATIPGMGSSIENNANAAAFGAVYTGVEPQVTVTVFLKLGTGCGGAAIVEGRLLRGADGTGMELGHMRVAEAGPLCKCGQRGCLETWVNLAALARVYLGREAGPGDDLDALPERVARSWHAGEARAVEAVSSVASHLATGLVSLVNLFNPARIVLGGAMRPVLQCGLQAIREAVAGRIIPGTRVPEIALSHLGAYECAIGAACIAHHRAFGLSAVDIGGLAADFDRPEPA